MNDGYSEILDEEENVTKQDKLEKEEPDLLTRKDLESIDAEKTKSYYSIGLKMHIINRIGNPLLILILIAIGVPKFLKESGSDLGFTDYHLNVIWVIVTFLTILHIILNVPIDFFNERIEREYGFATRTWKRWTRDHILGFLIGIIISTIIFTLLFSLLNDFPGDWWFYAFFGYFLIAAILSTLAPILIMPLFMKLEPFPQGKVREMIENLAMRMNFKYKEIYLWHLSQQSTKANAAVMGFGKTIRVALGDTLIDKYRTDEIEVIMAHEITHQKNKDIYLLILLQGFMMLIAFFTIDLIFNSAIDIFDYTGKSDPATFGFLLLSLGVIMDILSIVLMAISRRREKIADLKALEVTKNLPAYNSAFIRLAIGSLSYLYPSKFDVWLRRNHPPILERLAYAEN